MASSTTPTLPDLIRRTVFDFLQARIALDQFEDRLIGWSFDADRWAPDATRDLLNEIEFLLWRFRAGTITLADLRQALKDLIT